MSLTGGNVKIQALAVKAPKKQWVSDAKLLQRDGLTITEIAETLGVDRQTIADSLYWAIVDDRSPSPEIEPQRAPYAGKL